MTHLNRQIVAAFVLLLLPTGCGPPYETDSESMFKGKSLFFGSYLVGDKEIHYVETGQQRKSPVIFIHGTPGSWKAFAGFLANDELGAELRMIAVDRPGFGASANTGIVLSLGEQAAMLEPLVRTSGGQCRPLLVGHSLGASVAARLALDYPDSVAGLLLVAPSLDPELEVPRWYNRLVASAPFRWLVPAELAKANREVMVLKGELEEMLPGWSSLHIPVTVVQGERDKLVDPATAAFAERTLPGPARVVRVPEAGHFILWNQPEIIKEELKKLYQRVSCNTADTGC